MTQAALSVQPVVADDAVIESDDVEIGPGASIESGVRLCARRVRIGAGATVEKGCSIRGLADQMEEFRIGDHSFIGFENQILASHFAMGDYSQLHNSGLHTGYKPLLIGHNCWIGQNSILNCTEVLTIGNNVRIGTQSQLWTHVASGELLEGCTLFGENPLTLEDNVWIVGGGVISPGLTLGHHSIIMTGSVLTKSTEPFHTYAGVPAKDVTDKLSFWKPMDEPAKWEMLQGFVAEFRSAHKGQAEHIMCSERSAEWRGAPAGSVIVLRRASEAQWKQADELGVSLFDLERKCYSKQNSAAEVAWMRWLNGYRARFLPRGSEIFYKGIT